MDPVKSEHTALSLGTMGDRELKPPCPAAAGSAEMLQRTMSSADTSTTSATHPFEERMEPADIHDDGSNMSNSDVSDSVANSPNVIILEPGFSLVANSVVVVKCDYGPIKPKTFTYNLSIVNNTAEPMELNYQPLMRPAALQQDHMQTSAPVIPGILPSTELATSVHIPMATSSGHVSAKPGRIVKEEPVDYSITMNTSSDTEVEGSRHMDEFPGGHSSEGSVHGDPLAYGKESSTLDKQGPLSKSKKGPSSTFMKPQSTHVMTEAGLVSKDGHQPGKSSEMDMSSMFLIPQSTHAKSTDAGLASKVDELFAGLHHLGYQQQLPNVTSPMPAGVNIATNPIPGSQELGYAAVEENFRKGLIKTGKAKSKDGHMRQRCVVKCPQCDKIFQNNSKLKRHSAVHSTETPFICPVCTKGFKTARYLEAHEKCHSAEKRYKCHYPECDKSYRQWLGLDYHINSFHTKEKNHLCDLCGKGYATTNCLRTHKLTHFKTNDRNFLCEYCVKTFKTKEGLALHTRIHTGDRRYPCRHCEKRFITSCERLRHERRHTGEKPYKCQYCEKTFRMHGPWIDHMNIHTGARPFKCRFCDISFTSKSTRHKHEKSHKKEAEAKERTESQYASFISTSLNLLHSLTIIWIIEILA